MKVERKKITGGFTLIELLIAIAVIGILISLLVPAVNKVMDSARRTKGANCLKQIAMAYSQYCNDDVNGRNINLTDKATGKEWALVLARGGYLNDPNIYSFSGDSGASKVVRKAIVDSSLADNNAWDGDDDIEFSVYLINNVPMDAPLSTTPIAFTRGIPEVSGGVARWPENKSDPKEGGVYGSKGGYIAYLDGHVEWYEDLGGDGEEGNSAGKLVAWGGGGTTNDILQTIPSSAAVLKASGVKENGTGSESGGGDSKPEVL
ncbi:MAG: prepilin-type N-terminal cleavage/methylation domain-containing protein [Puniceicoccales bacterium]|jgi:prepilin-type N-terminal cleavage/methylation domain-containing protein/prepilin-type processing-associated H-X9-DG protein|nr:prepilin-type N-terminal cleavage/methylation domain-containing protein [Puniceicoccales bacterium]